MGRMGCWRKDGLVFFFFEIGSLGGCLAVHEKNFVYSRRKCSISTLLRQSLIQEITSKLVFVSGKSRLPLKLNVKYDSSIWHPTSHLHMTAPPIKYFKGSQNSFDYSTAICMPITPIDYRCDNGKKSLELGQHLGTIALLRTPGFEKCRRLTLSNHLFIRKLKKTTLHWLSIPNPNISEFTYFGKYICRLGIVDFNVSRNW